jgi:hypothetical protein
MHTTYVLYAQFSTIATSPPARAGRVCYRRRLRRERRAHRDEGIAALVAALPLPLVVPLGAICTLAILRAPQQERRISPTTPAALLSFPTQVRDCLSWQLALRVRNFSRF